MSSNGKAAFVEDLDSAQADALDGGNFIVDPWPELLAVFSEFDKRLDEPRDRAELGSFIREFFRVLLAPYERGGRNVDRLIGRRALAFAWTIDPSLIEGSPSLSEIARRLAIHKVQISTHSAAFRRRFRVRNRPQCHAANFNPHKESKP